MIRFIIVTGLTLVTISLGSLVWPKFTKQPRPSQLQQVHDTVLKTEVGQEVANVMGVTNETNVQPVSLSTMVASVGATIINGVQQRASELVSSQAQMVILNQYKQLPPPAQQELQQAICKPQ